MADLATRVDKLEGCMTSLEITVEKLSQKIDDYISESREMRARQDAERARQDAEMREFRTKHDADINAINSRIDNNVNQIRTEIQSLSNYFKATNITVMVGIAAMVVAVLLK